MGPDEMVTPDEIKETLRKLDMKKPLSEKEKGIIRMLQEATQGTNIKIPDPEKL